MQIMRYLFLREYKLNCAKNNLIISSDKIYVIAITKYVILVDEIFFLLLYKKQQ
jgi:hypothetical protein